MNQNLGKHWAVVRVNDLNEICEFMLAGGNMGTPQDFDQIALYKHSREARLASVVHPGTVLAFIE